MKRSLPGLLLLQMIFGAMPAMAQQDYRPDYYDSPDRYGAQVGQADPRPDWGSSGGPAWDEAAFDAPKQPGAGYRWRGFDVRQGGASGRWGDQAYRGRRNSGARRGGDEYQGFRFRDAPELEQARQSAGEHRFRPPSAREGAEAHGWGVHYPQNASGEYPQPSPVFRPWEEGERGPADRGRPSRFDDGQPRPDGFSFDEQWRPAAGYPDSAPQW